MSWQSSIIPYDTVIFHVDVNAAFLSWTAVKRLEEDPGAVDLRTIPSAVAGDVESRHGIITAKSLPAGQYGVRTAEPVGMAKSKCPSLVLVPSDFTTYRRYSRALMEILHTYSDRVQQVSIDEAYLDMSNTKERFRHDPSGLPWPVSAAMALKNEVRDRLKFTVNVGISVNKLLAKTASDFTKPDRIHTLWPEEVPAKLWTLPIGELHGCGRRTAAKLMQMGIETVGDAACTDPEILKSVLGEKGGEYIYKSANGRGSVNVRGEREEAKSYSNETTTAEDISADNYEEMAVPIIRKLSESVARRLQRDGVYAKTVDVSVKTETFQRRSRQTTLYESTNSGKIINETAQTLMRELLFSKNGIFMSGHGIRLIGVGGTNLDHGEYRQMNLFEYQEAGAALMRERKRAEAAKKKAETLRDMMDGIREKYGEDSIRRGLRKSD